MLLSGDPLPLAALLALPRERADERIDRSSPSAVNVFKAALAARRGATRSSCLPMTPLTTSAIRL